LAGLAGLARIKETGPVLGPVGIAFQPTVETVYPGGGAYLAGGFGVVFVRKKRAGAAHVSAGVKAVRPFH